MHACVWRFEVASCNRVSLKSIRFFAKKRSDTSLTDFEYTVIYQLWYRLWNMISNIKRGMQAKGIRKQDPEANIWAQEGWEWGRRRVHNEELHNFYLSPNIVRVIKSRRLRWAGHVAWMEVDRSAFKILTGTHTGKRPLGRPRRR